MDTDIRHVARLSWGILHGTDDDPAMAEFFDNIDRVHAVTARCKGYVARFEKDEEDVRRIILPDIGDREHRGISSFTAWETPQDLRDFVRKTVHGRFLDRRTDWFEVIDKPTYVIWPIEPGQVPDILEARARRDLLAQKGATPEAFDFAYLEACEHAGIAT